MGGGGGGAVDVKVKEMDRGVLMSVVLEHVVCGGLRGGLFVELMELLGRTGYRKDWTQKEGGSAVAAAQEEEVG